MSDYEQLSRAELLEQLRALREGDLLTLRQELQLHQEELRAEHEQLVQAHADLEASRDEYAELFDFAPLPYLILDHVGIIWSVNMAACAQLGIARSNVLGLTFRHFLSTEDRQRFDDHLRRHRGAAGHSSLDLTLQTRDGRQVPVQLLMRLRSYGRYFVLLRDRIAAAVEPRLGADPQQAGATAAHLAVAAELDQARAALEAQVVERGQAEAALQDGNRRKDEFLALLGHELRNPLGPIRNAAEVLRHLSGAPSELVELAEIIERQSRHMSRIVDDLLDLSRVTRARLELRQGPVLLTQLVSQVVADFVLTFDERGVSLRQAMSPEPLWIRGDETRLVQILSNLLQNAVRFTGRNGSVVVKLARSAEGNWAELRVIDTGVGISAERLEQLFDPLSQFDGRLAGHRGGLGLGLALVKSLVELHGGAVKAVSGGLGLGAEFQILLPLTAPPEQLPDEPTPAAPATGCRVLVVDDEPDSATTLQKLLESLGHQVYVAADGDEAMRLARQTSPELVFSDLEMPLVDGCELARMLRQDPCVQGAVLAAVTGYCVPDLQRQALAAGFDRCWVKPLTRSQVEEALQLVSRRQLK